MQEMNDKSDKEEKCRSCLSENTRKNANAKNQIHIKKQLSLNGSKPSSSNSSTQSKYSNSKM